MPIRSLADLPILEPTSIPPKSTILARVDLNIPLSKDSSPASFARIDAVLPLLRQTEDHSLLLCSHFARPQQHPENHNAYSLRNLVPFLEQRWQRNIVFLGDSQHPEAVTPETLASMRESNAVGLFENLRFHPGEEKNDLVFAKNLASHASLYVNDAFSVCHRAHASTSAVASLLPSYAGPSLIEELETLLPLLAERQQRSIALIGGAKVSSKIDLLQSLVEHCSALCLGGAMANCFLAARGVLPADAFEAKELQSAALLEKQIEEQKFRCLLLLPVDGACLEQGEGGIFKNANGEQESLPRVDVPLEGCTMPVGDIGSESCRAIEKLLDGAERGTRVIVNGPMGIVERPPFDMATLRLLRFLAIKTEQGALLTIAGGGDTLAVLEQAGVAQKFTHRSLGGGAFLALLSGERLPALEALRAQREACS